MRHALCQSVRAVNQAGDPMAERKRTRAEPVEELSIRDLVFYRLSRIASLMGAVAGSVEKA